MIRRSFQKQILLSFLTAALLSCPQYLQAEEGKKIPAASVEVFTEGQTVPRSYEVLSPISEKGKNDQDAFEKIKKTGAKMGANAVIDFECEAVSKQSYYGGWGVGGAQSVCRGKAVRWR